jgi:hypothetical protein
MVTTQERFNMLFQVKADIKKALEEKGRAPSDDFTTYATEIELMELGHLPTQDIAVIPTVESSVYTPDSGYVFSSVLVHGVDSSIDSNIVPGSILFGKNILGIEGNVQPLSIGPRPNNFYKLVRFYDYDGTLLNQQWVQTGDNATPPPIPGHGGLLFQEWNNSYLNITRDTDLCAIYTPSLGRSRLIIEITPFTGLSLSFFFTKNDNADMTILWDDGSAPEVTNQSGSISINHTFPEAGVYNVEIDINGGTYSLGGGATTSVLIGGSSQSQRDSLLEVNLGPGVGIAANGLSGMNSLRAISVPNTVGAIGNLAFSGTRCDFLGLPSTISTIGTGVIQSSTTFIGTFLPNSLGSIPGNTFYNCSSLRDVYIPSGLASIGANAFAGAVSLERLEFDTLLSSISSSAFSGCVRLKEIIFPGSSIITLASSNAFLGINPLAKIYVPDNLVDEYKITTNWAALADHIKPLSEYSG